MTAGTEIERPSNALAPWEDDNSDPLGELRNEEIPTPRLRIVHEEHEFENADTSERYPVLDAIILGLVRARVMWPPEVEEDAVPMCRSLDALTGEPCVDDDIPVKKQFPWKASNFERKNLLVREGTDQPLIACADCKFKDWDNETGTPGPCAEQLILPVLYRDHHDNWVPGILSFQKSAFKATTRYLGYMKAAHQPPFMYYTKITLETAHKGTKEYSVPKFHKGDMTPAGENNANWLQHHALFGDIREFLRRPRRSYAEDDEAFKATKPVPGASADNTNRGPVAEDDPWGAPADVVDAETVEEPPLPEAPAEEEDLF